MPFADTAGGVGTIGQGLNTGMIVYRNQERAASSIELLADLRRRLESGPSGHDEMVELLIDFGELESGVAEALCPDADTPSEILDAFREASALLGHAFCFSWRRQPQQAAAALAKLKTAVFRLASLALPRAVRVSVPEGYAYYGLYPESYALAAERFAADVGPQRAMVIGIRSIGTSLSAVVSARLEQLGVETDSCTVRPRGHPFDRRLALSPEFERRLGGRADSFFVVIDEGPGLSGSSMTCAGRAISELGVPDDRIVLFPSWEPNGTTFVSQAARERWPRHKKYTSDFRPAWLDRIATEDISAGEWRHIVCESESDFPAVQPQHERRKYLCRETNPPTLFKFAGLGRYGKAKLARAERLAEAGFTPRALGIQDGFVETQFVPGRPVRGANAALLETMARYLVFLEREFPSPRSMAFEELISMIRVNTLEGLGAEWAARLDLERFRAAASSAPAAALDGRMLPHEWLACDGAYLKSDALDHHEDHFFPGPQNIAWDLAGTCVEFAFASESQDFLLSRYERLAGERVPRERLQLYRLAYLAYRLGYATMASRAIAPSPDARRFHALAGRYASLLRQEIRMQSD